MKVQELLSKCVRNSKVDGWVMRAKLNETYPDIGTFMVINYDPIKICLAIKGWKTNRSWDFHFKSSSSPLSIKYNKREILCTDDIDEAIVKINQHNEKLISLERKIINTKAIKGKDTGLLIMESLRSKMPTGVSVKCNGSEYEFQFKPMDDPYYFNVRSTVKSDGAHLEINTSTTVGGFYFKVEMADPSFVPDEFIEYFFSLMIKTSNILGEAAKSIEKTWANGYIKHQNT